MTADSSKHRCPRRIVSFLQYLAVNTNLGDTQARAMMYLLVSTLWHMMKTTQRISTAGTRPDTRAKLLKISATPMVHLTKYCATFESMVSGGIGVDESRSLGAAYLLRAMKERCIENRTRSPINERRWQGLVPRPKEAGGGYKQRQ